MCKLKTKRVKKEDLEHWVPPVSAFISHPLGPSVLLSGLLYALLSLSDQLLFSFALVFASVLHDFVSLTKKNTGLDKETTTGELSKYTQSRGTI